MHNIIQTIQHAARAATVLLIALLAAQTAGAQTNVSDADGLVRAFDDTNVSVINVTDNITGVDYTLSPSWHDITIYLDGHTISGNRLSFNTNGCKLTINGGGQDGSVGNIISGNANAPAIQNDGTVTLSHVNITTNYDYAINGGKLNIGNNVSFNGWTSEPFAPLSVNITGNYNYDPENLLANVVATVTVGGTPHYFENIDAALTYILSQPAHFSVNDAGTEYTIHTANGWDLFCELLANSTQGFFDGKTVKLDASIGTAAEPVTRMAGGSNHAFTGTFDGNHKTLTLNYGTAQAPIDAEFVAPFVEVSGGATFINLNIDGHIYAAYTGSSESGVGGLIGHLFGGITIEGCTSTVEINSTKDRVGGFVGLCEHAVTFTDCKSSAVVTCTGSGSGFVGWSRASEYTIAFYGCLFNGKVLKKNGVGSGNGGFSEYGADANGDGQVTVTDIGVIVDKILGVNNSSAASRRLQQEVEPQ